MYNSSWTYNQRKERINLLKSKNKDLLEQINTLNNQLAEKVATLETQVQKIREMVTELNRTHEEAEERPNN